MPKFEPRQGSRKNASPRVSSSSHRPLTPRRVTALVLREQRDFVRLGEKGAMPAAGVAIANKYT
ncbi:hypothetical protein [Nostoc sp. JL31]|uniref:hypothetical protein n=1 Tax=Nostoc sp. JL31 TaxID=2815395 RepID=UPI0025D12C4F|nr:hypothetical protein [Nostoc sp. JL31]